MVPGAAKTARGKAVATPAAPAAIMKSRRFMWFTPCRCLRAIVPGLLQSWTNPSSMTAVRLLTL
jgi:hypothetical protein